MRPTIVAAAPTRLDFGGGWTDVPPYPEERGGFVCSLAISRMATARVSAPDAPGPGAVNASPLVLAAIRQAGIGSAAVSLESDFPLGAGLGGSSAAGVALAAALAHWNGTNLDASALAEWSREIEVRELGIAGGRQDHYAAAFGGALALTFGASVEVERISLGPVTVESLESRCLVVYTGESRISATTITSVIDAYRDREPRVLNALDRMGALAVQMANALESGDVDGLGLLVGEHWHFQQSLHPAITTARIDAIQDAAMRAGALGLKALGASGGGCVLVITPHGGTERVLEAVQPFGEILPWHIAADGVRVFENGARTLPVARPRG